MVAAFLAALKCRIRLKRHVWGCRAFFKARFEQLEDSLFEQHRDLFPPHVFSFQAFLWAVSTVRARVHPPLEGDRVALVPGADLVAPGPHVHLPLPFSLI